MNGGSGSAEWWLDDGEKDGGEEEEAGANRARGERNEAEAEGGVEEEGAEYPEDKYFACSAKRDDDLNVVDDDIDRESCGTTVCFWCLSSCVLLSYRRTTDDRTGGRSSRACVVVDVEEEEKEDLIFFFFVVVVVVVKGRPRPILAPRAWVSYTSATAPWVTLSPWVPRMRNRVPQATTRVTPTPRAASAAPRPPTT